VVLDRAMRAAVIQFEPGQQRAANIAVSAALIAEAVAADRPTLISLPEMWTCLGGDRTVKLDQAESLPRPGGEAAPGSAYAFLQHTARRYGLTVHGGSLGERVGDTLFNTSLVFGPDGAECARYRKIHLFDVTTPSGQGYRESALFGAGDQIVTTQGGGMCLGLTICYDLRFPELFLALRRQGAQVIFVPAAFTAETGRDHWEVLLRARAIETQCWIIAAATTGQHHDARNQPRSTWGHAMIIDPWGTVQACLGTAPGFAVATIDPGVIDRVRDSMPVLHHRRLV
jgi:predicted amidohydrolase